MFNRTVLTPPGRVLWTADTHFGHAGAIAHSGRPFASADEMDRLMAEAWNATVGANDTVIHLGDFAMGLKGEHLEKMFASLKGRKILVAGNHDRAATFALGWESIHERVTVVTSAHRIVCDHYPLRSWDRAYHGSLHFHGHVHGKFGGTSQSCDLGVDVWGYRPVALPEILARLAATPTPPEEWIGNETASEEGNDA
ncbi:metallophosphoesterase [Methylobacterium fujisawaense]|uniref:metallophosphoesterase n=1 Tax=Methylobacterium fujisawaense TaxID=107400 RepID=UPI0036F80F41